METLLLIAFSAAILGLVVSLVVLYQFAFSRNSKFTGLKL